MPEALARPAVAVDAIVVGGGILGLAAAWHLHEAGVDRVVVVERDAVAAATTSAGAGFVAVWAAGHAHAAWDASEAALERHGIDFYVGLADDGADIGLRRDGMLWVATTAAGHDEHLAPLIGHPLAPEAMLLDGREVAQLTGVCDADAVHSAVYHPSAIRVSAPAAAAAVAARLRRAGVEVRERCPVARLLVEDGRIRGVETPTGPLRAEHVVLAAGAWSNALLAGVAPSLPMAAMAVARITSAPCGIPASMPPMLFPEQDHLWVREEAGGLLYGASFECAPRYDVLERTPERFDELALDGFFAVQHSARLLADALPALGRTTGLRVKHGAPCYTPDLRGIVGALPEIDGLWVVGGCNEAGVTHAAGYGALLAALMTGGAPLCDAAPFAPRRFGDRIASPPQVVAAMADRGRLAWVAMDR